MLNSTCYSSSDHVVRGVYGMLDSTCHSTPFALPHSAILNMLHRPPDHAVRCRTDKCRTVRCRPDRCRPDRCRTDTCRMGRCRTDTCLTGRRRIDTCRMDRRRTDMCTLRVGPSLCSLGALCQAVLRRSYNNEKI